MKNIWKTLVSVCASAVLLFSVLLSVGVVMKNKDINSTTNNQEQTQRPSGSVSGGEIEIDQSSPYSKVYYASATAETGAAEAEAGEKGGAISMEDGTDEDIAAGKTSSMSMTGSVIQGYNAEYGGAIYVGKGCTLTLTNGTICNNTATYGGAIYVADGGTFIMNGGRIADNTSTSGGAVYVEFGGTVEFNGGVVVEGNEMSISGYTISEDTIDGFHYMEYGSYPQSYVGDTMNTTLESWYTNSSPTAVTTYTTDSQEWNAYTYTDGNTYARGMSNPNSTTITYRDGTIIKAKDTVVWFKVEPIVWLVTNYENVLSGVDNTVKILSYVGISSDISFGSNYSNWASTQMCTWLNTNFLTTAFSVNEQSRINMSTIKNNVVGGAGSPAFSTYVPESDGTGEDSTQKIYLLSFDESIELIGKNKIVCSPTDYSLSNLSLLMTFEDVTPSYRSGYYSWWLRSKGDSEKMFCESIGNSVEGCSESSIYVTGPTIRPALQLML